MDAFNYLNICPLNAEKNQNYKRLQVWDDFCDDTWSVQEGTVLSTNLSSHRCLYKPNTKSLRQSTNHLCFLFFRNQFYFVRIKLQPFFSLFIIFFDFSISVSIFSLSKMEVSVIGNPQTKKIYRAELTYRELGFRLGSQNISGDSRNRVSFLTHQSSKWKEIKIRSSPRSVRCEASVSDQAPFLKPTPNSRSVITTFSAIGSSNSYKFQ